MANYKTQGIVLKRSNFGEADRLLTIFTKKHGKIKAIAKGVRRQNSKLAGSLEPFCLSELVLAEGRNFAIVTEAEIIECFFAIRNHLPSTNFSYYLAESVDKLTAEHEPHEKVFNLLAQVLKNVNNINDNLLLAFYEMNLFSELGFEPELETCLSCRKKITPGKNQFDFREGGLVCSDCQSHGKPVSDQAIKLLKFFRTRPLQDLKKIKTTEKYLKETRSITENYLEMITEQEFKSRRFINGV